MTSPTITSAARAAGGGDVLGATGALDALDELAFDGDPADPDVWTSVTGPAPSRDGTVGAPADMASGDIAGGDPVPGERGDLATELVGQLRGGLVAAHASALRVQAAFADQALALLREAASVPATGTAPAGVPAARQVAAALPSTAARAISPPAEITVATELAPAVPGETGGWLTLPALLRAGWARLAARSAHLASLPPGGVELTRATVRALGPLPAAGERLWLRATTRAAGGLAAATGMGGAGAGLAVEMRIDGPSGPIVQVTDCLLSPATAGVDRPAARGGADGADGAAARHASREPGPYAWTPRWTEPAFKPLARAAVTTLDAAALGRLARGDVAGVLGAAYDQEGANPAIRLGGPWPLAAVTELEPRGGQLGRGLLRAAASPAPPAGVPGADTALWALDAAWQAVSVFALYLGLHLVMADSHLDVALPDPRLVLPEGIGVTDVEIHDAAGLGAAGPAVELELTVTDVDLVPRPWLRGDVALLVGGRPVATVRGMAVAVREAPGVPIAPLAGGEVPGFLGRRGPDGTRALLGELHMAHGARGDLAIALGPEFASSMGRRACRLPGGGLRLVDRFMSVQGRRGELGGGATAVTEYDSPADAWYYTDSATPTMPNVIHMETSLQSALMLGYYLGATLTDPDEQYCLRNLDGTATLLRDVDLAGRTIRQTSTLLSTTVLTGAVLQNFSYELAVDGEPFYAGESLFGFFNDTTLANQNGLDGGDFVPTWLERTRPPAAAARTIDVAARRATGAPLCATGAMALLDEVTVVDGGGDHGRGYLHATRQVRADDWFFSRHFWLDPVMPGSLGIEAVIQAIQEWMVDTGLADGLDEPVFVLPTGLPMSWRYRGQILADDGEMTIEAHIREMLRGPGRVRVVADASVWKPGLRIYGLTDIAAEIRAADARGQGVGDLVPTDGRGERGERGEGA
ncbi:beta-hydroxydecanoyl-ACP dehydratase [Pseudofrankia asymbiotica]|uniref:Uncharacterized protein n=1 Tax=Pseudofrankia asymbiotica TaxID=1834516 RepID=A0A1V2IEG6_9ACTN|nr:beta-hydroxydecanoyl-ACP dehydratase [Pseudofrankia asymbiotica]ONH31465.1 hypothetical protein BL253_09590 [Pseudofrankia asymbiotica]